LKVLTGSANTALSSEIARYLGVDIVVVETSRFADGEMFVHVKDNVRGADVFLIQPTCPPVNDNLMELLLIADALKRSSAKRITAIIPYYGYARQDRKAKPRVPISAKLVADLLTTAGVHRVLTMDLHADQIQGFFNIPVDHLYFSNVLIEYLNTKQFKDLVIVSPDAGGVDRARHIAKRMNAHLAIIDKRREVANEVVFNYLIGDVKDKQCVIVDDIIDTAGSMCQAVNVLVREGAKRVIAVGAHGVLSGPAIERLREAPVEEIIISNSIPLPAEKKLDKITILSVAKMLAEAIRRIHHEESLSLIFTQ